MVEHLSANPKVPGSILDLCGLIPGDMDSDEACIMHLTPGVVHNSPKPVGV